MAKSVKLVKKRKIGHNRKIGQKNVIGQSSRLKIGQIRKTWQEKVKHGKKRKTWHKNRTNKCCFTWGKITLI